MKPEIVLNLKSGDNAEKIRDEWLREYKAYADEFTNTEEAAALLSCRVKHAYELISGQCHADMPELDGDFPLGNEADAVFAGTYFPVADLVSIQLGYENLVDCGYYTEYNDAVLARLGFIAEMKGEWLEAARCYEGVSGCETVQDREYACRRKAKEKGEKLYAEAQGYMESGEWKEVFWPLQCAADMGNTDAMTDLGLARIYGQFGCAKDTEEALKLLRSAANGGNDRAAFEICELYDSGVQIDAHEALNMCRKAADAGNEKAKIRLADGFDLRPVREILQEQIDKGNTDAMWYMALQCEHEQDTDGYREWLLKAAESGQVDALLKGAEMYMDKSSEDFCKEFAIQCLHRAADAGSVKAIMKLGDLELCDTQISFRDTALLLNDSDRKTEMPDETVKEQHKKQFALYELAAQAGEISAIQAVCQSYLLGYPVEQEYEKAFFWASRGANENDGVCMYIAAYLYESGLGVANDTDTAIALYTQAADFGVRPAMIRLYRIYSAGFEHIPVDPDKASHYLFLSGEGRD